MFKIALDAGHGLYTPGKRVLKSLDAKETREWFLNDRICDLIEKKMASYGGYEILRVDDTTGAVDVSLSKRVTAANTWGADFYLSVHHNAGINGGSGGGIISIVYTDASSESLRYQKIIYDELIKATGLKGNRSVPCPKQNLYVCRETKMPSVLVECGFMDSSTDVPVILTEKFADECAEGLVAALVKIGGLELKEKGSADVVTFVDIEGHYAEKAIIDLARMGIVKGVTDTEFSPEKMATRTEVAVIARNIIRYITGE